MVNLFILPVLGTFKLNPPPKPCAVACSQSPEDIPNTLFMFVTREHVVLVEVGHVDGAPEYERVRVPIPMDPSGRLTGLTGRAGEGRKRCVAACCPAGRSRKDGVEPKAPRPHPCANRI